MRADLVCSAAWLMRIEVSSGKSVSKRFAICCGLHALDHRRACLRPCSAKETYRPDGSGADGARFDGGIPPHCRNHRLPTAGDTPAMPAASSLEYPFEIAFQNRPRSARCNTGGQPGERGFARSDRSDFNFFELIDTSNQGVLRRRVEFTFCTARGYVGHVWLTTGACTPEAGSAPTGMASEGHIARVRELTYGPRRARARSAL